MTCFRLQEVLCDLTSILQKQRGGKDDRKVSGEQGERVSRPQSECAALAGGPDGPDEAEMRFNT